MGRTAVIVLSSVVIFTVGLITSLFGALNIISDMNGRGSAAGYFGSFTIPAAIALIGLGGWGVASGVGISKMKEWARISMLAFGAIFFVIAAFGALEMVLDPYVGVSYMDGAYMGSIRPEMMAFYGVVTALGAFWLYFFSRKSVKAQFWSVD